MSACPPRPRTRTIAGLLAATVGVTTLIAAACGADPRPSSPRSPTLGSSERLLALTGAPGERRLVAYTDGVATMLELPPGETTWMAGDERGALAATRADGAILVQVDEGASWQPIDPGAAVPALDGHPVMATWSPDGRLAAIVADVETASVSGALVLDPATGESRLHPLAMGLEGSPPAWLSDTLVALPGRERDLPRITVLDTDDGSTLIIRDPIRALAASADGSTVALIRGDAAEVEVWQAGPWLAARRAGGEPSPDARLAVLHPPAGAIRPAALALDPTGDRVAVGWSDADGTTGRVTVHAASDGWAPVSGVSIEPTSAVPALAWVP